MKDLFPGYMGIPIPVPTKLQEIFPVKLSATEIHAESHSCISVHTVTVNTIKYCLKSYLHIKTCLGSFPALLYQYLYSH